MILQFTLETEMVLVLGDLVNVEHGGYHGVGQVPHVRGAGRYTVVADLRRVYLDFPRVLTYLVDDKVIGKVVS